MRCCHRRGHTRYDPTHARRGHRLALVATACDEKLQKPHREHTPKGKIGACEDPTRPASYMYRYGDSHRTKKFYLFPDRKTAVERMYSDGCTRWAAHVWGGKKLDPNEKTSLNFFMACCPAEKK